jgi:CRISPR/Cas system CMR subunit Cmr4 (Cas7 group RAMP superfamily)
MITIKLTLTQFKHAVRKMKNAAGIEVDCLIIPIEQNKLYKGEKGVYLDMIAFEVKEKKNDSKDTHILKQSFSKDDRAKMTEDQLKELPILGNLRIWEPQEQNTIELEPVTASPEEPNDLPF